VIGQSKDSIKMPQATARPYDTGCAPQQESTAMKVKKLASDTQFVERVRRALTEVRYGRTVSLSKLSKAVEKKRSEIARQKAHEARA
jgi:hypothetical protein